MAALDTIPAIDIDPFSTEALRDPAPFHAALREAGDFVYLSHYKIWATGRFDRVREILSDWQTYCSSGGVGLTNFHKEKPWRPPSLVLEHDPPEHTRNRAVMMRALAPAVLRGLRPAFEKEAERQVARLVEMETFDAVTELAEGYPLKVFGDAVGIKATDRRLLLRYGDIAFNALGPRNKLFLDAIDEEGPVTEWIMEQCRRDALDPDGLGAIMYRAADAGDVTEDQAGMLVRSFLSAGVDTTVRALGGALLCFSESPEQWQTLREKPELARNATEEAIRHASPFQTVFRTTTREVELDGVRLGADEKILLSLGAANHDPDQWDHPETFDVERRTAGHVGFGAGIHGCAGQMLARLEMEVLLAELARQVGRIERVGDIDYALNNTTRGLSRLSVRISAA
jgi:cytochrome P450